MWRHYYTGEELDLSFGVVDTLNGGTIENCAIMVSLWKGWVDWTCLISKVSRLYLVVKSIHIFIPQGPFSVLCL